VANERIARGRHLSYQRSKRAVNPKTSLIKIEGVDDTKAAEYAALQPKRGSNGLSFANCRRSFYLGKRIAYIYKGSTEKRGTKFRVIWGKVTRPHGTCIAERANPRVLAAFTMCWNLAN
jgi:large subunit ribosomal protein L35Ae